MITTPQKKGRSHIDYIREIAIAYWAKMEWKDGFYPVCLRDAMREHREYLIRCENEKIKIAFEKKQRKELRCKECMTPLETNDIFHYGYYCRDCFQAHANDEIIPTAPKIANVWPT